MRWLWWGVAAVNLAVAFLAQSRGAVLALFLGGAVAVGGRLPRGAQLAALGLLALAGSAIWAFPQAAGTIPLLARIEQHGMSDPRLFAWKGGIEAAYDRPLLGWGQDQFREVYKHYCRAYCGEFDRAHDFVIDWLVNGGLLGLDAWLLLLWAMRWSIRTGYGGARRDILLGFLACYVVSDLFLFDTLSSYLPLVAVMALASRASAGGAAAAAARTRRSPAGRASPQGRRRPF